MKTRTLATVDLDTGEIIPGVAAISKRKSKVYPEGFIMTARYGSRFVGRDKEITGVAHRVLRELESGLEYENWIPISLTCVANNLDISHAQVSRAMKILVEKGIVLKGDKVGHFYTYRLNPEFCWRGDPGKMAETISYIPSSEYTEARRAYLAEDAAKERERKGLQPLDGGKKVVNFQEEQKRRKKAQKLAEKFISSDIDLEALEEFLKKNGTR